MNQIHRKYLFSKINIIIILLVILIAGICYISTVNLGFNIYERWLNRKECWIDFYNTILFVGKFIGIVLAVYIMGTSFTPNLDGYNVLFLRNKKNRISYYISKSLTINLIVFLVIMVIGVIGIMIISGFSTWFNNFLDLFKLFFNLGLLSLVYGNLSIILILLFKSQLIVIVPFVLFIMIEVLTDVEFIHYVLILFPTINENANNLSSIHLLILIIIYNLISGLIYYKKDLA